MQSPTDRYSSWIRRAEAFVRRLNHLPGEWGISIAITPPAPQAQVDELTRLLPFGLPASLRNLYSEGAASCRCRYDWSPKQEILQRLQSVFPHEMSFHGGVELFPLAEMIDAHGIHSWWDNFDDNPTGEQQAARDVWRKTIPFIRVGNGDCVALHVTESPDIMPVVYLCHDDAECTVTTLSPSFDQFLDDWETLCYVGPAIWLLGEFLGENRRGPLDVRQENVQHWREALLGR